MHNQSWYISPWLTYMAALKARQSTAHMFYHYNSTEYTSRKTMTPDNVFRTLSVKL